MIVAQNPNHHKSTDTPDILDYEYLTSVTELTLATILNLDRLTTTTDTPSFSVLDFLVFIAQ